MNAKLGMNGAYNRRRDKGIPSQTYHKDRENDQFESASLTALESEIKTKTEENLSLKKELLELRQAVKQLLTENSHEKFDERRINLMKFQVIQLERQISLLTEALGSRSDAVLEVENAMTWLADTLRSYLASDVHGPIISISRKDLIALIESTESSRIKLFKCVENVNKDKVGKELLILNPFLAGKGKQEEAVSLLDISLHRLDYLNLRHVAQTESKMAVLYKELIRVHNQMEFLHGKGQHDLLLSSHIAPAQMDRVNVSLLKTCVVIKDVADDLLAISLLCPSSPWPVLKRPVSKDISIERVLEAIPNLPSTKQAEVNQVITASLGACNHRLYLMEKEKAALREEISFHQTVYDLQMQNTQTVLDAIRAGYREFEETVRNLLSKPVKSLLEAYEHLKASASETALRKILLIFKENEAQLSSIVEMLDTQEDSDDGSPSQGHKALSLLGEELMSKVDHCVKSHKKQMAPHLKDKREAREEQRRLETELRHLIEELEGKYEKQWIPGYRKNQISEDDSHQISMESSKTVKDKSDALCEFSITDKHKSKESPKDLNPSGLRAFLDEDYRQLDTGRKHGTKSRKANCDKEKLFTDYHLPVDNESTWPDKFKHDSNLHLKNDHKITDIEGEKSVFENPVTKKGGKILRKPQKEWVSDFSSFTPISDEPESSSRLSDINKQVDREDSWQNDNRSDNVLSLPQLTKKKVKKKEALTYEPNLNVVQRALKLKREGGLGKDSKGKK